RICTKRSLPRARMRAALPAAANAPIASSSVCGAMYRISVMVFPSVAPLSILSVIGRSPSGMSPSRLADDQAYTGMVTETPLLAAAARQAGAGLPCGQRRLRLLRPFRSQLRQQLGFSLGFQAGAELALTLGRQRAEPGQCVR